MILSADNTAIVYDSTADLPDGPGEHTNWRMVPLTVAFGSETYRDYVDLAPDLFYRLLEAAALMPTTAQPSPAAFHAVYEQLLHGYDQIISLHISERLSGTVNSARLAAEGFPGRVIVVDTGGVSALLAFAVLAVNDALNQGVTRESLDAIVADHRARDRCFFSVPSLDYLQRGGRIGAARALLGQVLSVRPVLGFDDGELRPVARVRGAHRLADTLVAQILDASADWQRVRILIAHAACRPAAEDLATRIRGARAGVTVDAILTLGAVVGSHSGPGALGIACTDGAAS
jgi:DegV family protein with EDD domain